jgi:CRISPR/Cas system-associated exonuclease Cas4 (RecB family)
MNATAIAAEPVATRAGPAVVPDHLSWSGLQTYSQCPRKYHYRYILQAPAEFVPASLAFGSAIHAAVQLCHQARLEGRDIPAVDGLMNGYDGAWRVETTHVPEVNYAKNEDAVSLREMAARMLGAYRDHALQDTNNSQIIAIEHEERFRLLADVPPIEMRLDLLELQGPDLIVTDVKTSRSRWNDMKVQEHLPQLIMYSFGLLVLLRELGASRIVPQFLVVTKAKTPTIQVLRPHATQDDVERLKRMVSEMWDAIQKGVFVQREGWQCAQCPYRTRCLG